MKQKFFIPLILVLVASKHIAAKEIKQQSYKQHITAPYLLQYTQEEEDQVSITHSNLPSNTIKLAGEEFILITGSVTGAFFIGLLVIIGLS